MNIVRGLETLSGHRKEFMAVLHRVESDWREHSNHMERLFGPEAEFWVSPDKIKSRVDSVYQGHKSFSYQLQKEIWRHGKGAATLDILLTYGSKTTFTSQKLYLRSKETVPKDTVYLVLAQSVLLFANIQMYS